MKRKSDWNAAAFTITEWEMLYGNRAGDLMKVFQVWGNRIPDSCCKRTSTGQPVHCNQIEVKNEFTINTIGCLPVTKDFLKKHATILGLAGIIVACVLVRSGPETTKHNYMNIICRHWEWSSPVPSSSSSNKLKLFCVYRKNKTKPYETPFWFNQNSTTINYNITSKTKMQQIIKYIDIVIQIKELFYKSETFSSSGFRRDLYLFRLLAPLLILSKCKLKSIVRR